MDYDTMCPKYEAGIEILGKRWTGLIIRVLLGGPKRFRDIKEIVPEMSDKMLTERLKQLEAAQILVRNVYPETPVRVEYELTDKGKDLKDVVEAIQAWSEKWM